MKQINNRVGLMDKSPQIQEKNRAGAWFLGVLVVLAAGQAGYVFWQSSSLKSDIVATTKKITSKEATIKTLTSGVAIGEHKKSSEVLAQAEASRIDWSIAQRELTRLKGGLQNQVIIEDYTSNAQGGFSLQAVGHSMESVAIALDAFVESKTFSDPFVVSVTEIENNGLYDFSGRRPREVYRFFLIFNFTS